MKGNATARYKFNVADYESFFQGSVIHQSSSRADLRTLENSEFGELPQFTTFDFATGTGMHNWTVEAFVENAFDKRGALGRTNACAAAYCYTHYREFAIKPMNFGVKFGQKF
jgi:hypothetical protein